MTSWLLGAGDRWAGVDPGGVHPRGAPQPSGLGDVRVCLLLRHDPPLGGPLHRRVSQEWLGVGRRCKATSGKMSMSY